MNKIFRAGAGRNRKSWRIKEWLGERDMNMRRLSRDIDIDYTIVTRTVAGIDNNRRVLAHLKEIGCPIEILSLPEDLQR